jgi:hypothetical protein
METVTSDYDSLSALVQQYNAVDCWCGESFTGVVDRFIAVPWADDEDGEPDDEQPPYTELRAMSTLTCEERRDRLVADVKRLLEQLPTEEERRNLFLQRDGAYALEFTDFWMPNDIADDGRPASTLLKLIIADALTWDPHAYDSVMNFSAEQATDPALVSAHNQKCSAIMRSRALRSKAEFLALANL